LYLGLLLRDLRPKNVWDEKNVCDLMAGAQVGCCFGRLVKGNHGKTGGTPVGTQVHG